MIISPPVDIMVIIRNISQKTGVFSISRGATSFADVVTEAGRQFLVRRAACA